MRVALTGTPGTGKTTVASHLAREGLSVRSLLSLSQAGEAVAEYDAEREAWEVDLARLARDLPSEDPLVLVGHLSHRLPVDRVVVLRCHPDVLRRRLEERGWSPAKVAENVEAEAVGVITAEAMARAETFELDTTTSPPEATAETVQAILAEGGAAYRAPWVDWSEAILNWY